MEPSSFIALNLAAKLLSSVCLALSAFLNDGSHSARANSPALYVTKSSSSSSVSWHPPNNSAKSWRFHDVNSLASAVSPLDATPATCSSARRSMVGRKVFMASASMRRETTFLVAACLSPDCRRRLSSVKSFWRAGGSELSITAPSLLRNSSTLSAPPTTTVGRKKIFAEKTGPNSSTLFLMKASPSKMYCRLSLMPVKNPFRPGGGDSAILSDFEEAWAGVRAEACLSEGSGVEEKPRATFRREARTRTRMPILSSQWIRGFIR
mmetsp:Transcript_44502/g.108584  ORF Transcript_44502/g.108584 Transcript_44502/m.108584 type:complete len:265 (+) Transcript_44502:843-1637(+)